MQTIDILRDDPPDDAAVFEGGESAMDAGGLGLGKGAVAEGAAGPVAPPLLVATNKLLMLRRSRGDRGGEGVGGGLLVQHRRERAGRVGGRSVCHLACHHRLEARLVGPVHGTPVVGNTRAGAASGACDDDEASPGLDGHPGQRVELLQEACWQ